MDNFWFNFALEIALFSFLGILYYFYQKRKILRYEENKIPLVMEFILQNSLQDKTDASQPQLDLVIETLDDYLTHKTSSPPLLILKNFAQSPDCTPELRQIILDGLTEIE